MTPIIRQKKHYKVIVATGQSLALATTYESLSARRGQLRSNDARIKVWSSMPDLPVSQNLGYWTSLDTISADYVSMGRASARELSFVEDNVALIEVAKSGMGLDAYWKKGLAGYTLIIDQVTAALSKLASWGDTWEWAYYLRYQAHADCATVSAAETYNTLLPTHMADLRADLPNASGMTFVIGRAPDWGEPTGRLGLSTIRSGQVSIAEADGNATWCDTDGILIAGSMGSLGWGPSSDGVHPTGSGRCAVGIKAAKAIQALKT